MKYMCFIKHTEDYRKKPAPKALMDAMGVFVGDSIKKGIFLDGGGLKPTSEAVRVSLSGGKLKVTDGPFTESKEIIGGYAILELKTHEEAVAVAKEFMELHRIHWPEFEGESELRPMEDMPPQ